MMRVLALCACALLPLGGCALFENDLANAPPALADFEEPLELYAEPDDEAARQALPAGAFTGLYVKDARDGLEAMGQDPEGVLVTRVVENSPAALAGFAVEDLLLEASLGSGDPVPLNWPARFRELELAAKAGDRWTVLLDRAGEELELEIALVQRVAPAARTPTERVVETKKVGIALRNATEVEARRRGLPPGAGAVVVGLARSSPWRKAGLALGDQIVAVEGKPLLAMSHLQARIAAMQPGDRVRLGVARETGTETISVTVSERESDFHSFKIPVLFRHEQGRDTSDTSLLMGLLGYEDTGAAWEFRFLWFLTVTGGDADTLEEVTP